MYEKECRVSFVIVGATGLPNVSTFGKLDPYVKITYGKSVYKTSIIHDGGTSPRWNYEMCLTGTDTNLKVEVFDSRFFKDRLIGCADICLSSLKLGRQEMNVSLVDPKDSSSAGILRVIFKVYGDTCKMCCPQSYSSCYSGSCCIGNNFSLASCSCVAIPVQSMAYPTNNANMNSYSCCQPFVTNSCILQEIPNSYCRPTNCFMKYAVPASACHISVESRSTSRPSGYRNAMYSTRRAVTPNSVYPTI